MDFDKSQESGGKVKQWQDKPILLIFIVWKIFLRKICF